MDSGHIKVNLMMSKVDPPHQYRAGRYIRQLHGYRAFIPAPLPPNPPINISQKLYSILSKADRALGRLDGSVHTLPNADLFVFMYVRREAVLSSQIEGTQSSLQDVLAAEAHVLSADLPGDVGEVVNYVHAMNFGLERLKTLPLSIRLLREIHEKLLHGARGSGLTPGELRQTQNWIGPSGCTLNEAIFVPPPPHEAAEALGALEKFLHAPSDLPPLIQIGLVHAQFETIHPFLDGNGRLGRLLITFMLCHREFLLKPVLYLSHYFKKHRVEYYEKLQAVRDHGAWEDWLLFFLQGVATVSLQASETAKHILFLRETHRNQVTTKLGRAAGNGHLILEKFFERPIMSVKDVQGHIGTTYPAANTLVSKLAKLNILKEITGNRRNRQFRYESYIRLFSEPGDTFNSE